MLFQCRSARHAHRYGAFRKTSTVSTSSAPSSRRRGRRVGQLPQSRTVGLHRKELPAGVRILAQRVASRHEEDRPRLWSWEGMDDRLKSMRQPFWPGVGVAGLIAVVAVTLTEQRELAHVAADRFH